LAGVATARSAPKLTIAPPSAAVGERVAVRGYGFRPHLVGVVVFGTRRVASFRAGASGSFVVKFLVPAGRNRRLRVIAEQTARDRRGVIRRLSQAAAGFQVVSPAALSNPIAIVPPPLGPPPAIPALIVPPASSGGSGSSEGSGGTGGSTGGTEGSKGTGGSWWKPLEHLTWYWQLQGTVNNSEPVEAYDIDGFDNTAAEVTTLHNEGKHVVCYIDVGTWEEWRSDAGEFPKEVIGNSNGWPGEDYLNIADTSVLEPLMAKRFEMCKEKGFDAVEPDNMEDFEEKNTGFTITAAEQLTYDEWIAEEVHSLGMAVLQKNDPGQTNELEPHFDGALTEQCNEYGECGSFQPYLAAGKPVFNAEYNLSTSQFCAADNTAGIMGARYDLELDGKTFEPCW
jgi:hypothetical protein